MAIQAMIDASAQTNKENHVSPAHMRKRSQSVAMPNTENPFDSNDLSKRTLLFQYVLALVSNNKDLAKLEYQMSQK
jgi:hypothetical protein